jgi:hypothetical protein
VRPDDVLKHCLAINLSRTKYKFDPPPASPTDASPALLDCSELVRWACRRAGLAPEMPDGSWNQHLHSKSRGLMIPVSTGIATRGALLIKSRDALGNPIEPIPGGPPAQAHIAFSLGDGRTYEAMGPAPDKVGIFGAAGRPWTHAALIPGIVYSSGAPTPPSPPPTPPAPTPPAPAPAPVQPVPALPGNANPRWNRPTLRFGSSGLNVFFCQDLLRKLGFPGIALDGWYFSQTNAAMRDFQLRVRNTYAPSFSVDGVCGPFTWGWLLYLSGRGTE